MLAAIESRLRNPIDEEDIYLLATSAAYELQQLYTGFKKIIERHFEFTGVKAGTSPRYHKRFNSSRGIKAAVMLCKSTGWNHGCHFFRNRFLAH